MSYTPSHATNSNVFANPSALTCLIGDQNQTQSASVGAVMTYSTTINWHNSFSPSISSGIITLDSGYWYFLEASMQLADASYNINDYMSYQVYNESGSSYIGTPGLLYTSAGMDSQLTTRDEGTRALIDCTSSSIDVSIKISGLSGIGYYNYHPGLSSEYGGLGRCVIWQLSA